MRHTITYNQLFLVDQDLQRMQQAAPGMALILNSKIAQFYQRAQMHLKVLSSRMEEIKSKFIEKDEKGHFITIGEGENAQWKFKETYIDIKAAKTLSGEEVAERYEQEANEFLEKNIVIDL